MHAPANAVRFFGTFNFLTSPEPSQSMRYILYSSMLRYCPPLAQTVHIPCFMSDKTEKMNSQDHGLPVIPVADFKAEVLESKLPVLVEFWAPWSRPCQVLDSVLQELATACVGKVKVVKVNADDSLDLSLWYDIQSVPTLLCFVEGNPCLRILGTASKEAILAKLKPFS